ncbi:hypothetical protein NXX40_09055 [Parabacteroides distasonis]|nr:hypothetical protein [Parabacteroides distasonis]
MKNILIAIRSIFKKGRHNVMKIVSLGIGLAVGLVLIAKVYFEQSYDDFYPDRDRVYQVPGEIPAKWRGVEGLSANKRWHRSNYATTDTRDRDRHPIHEFWRPGPLR